MVLSVKNRECQYDKLPTEIDEGRNSTSNEEFTPENRSIIQRYGVVALLSVSNMVMILTLFAIFIRNERQAGHFVIGYPTDFKPAREHLEFEKVIFTGNPSFTISGEQFQHHPASVHYVGKPTPEVDQAWEALLLGGEFLATAEEAHSQWGTQGEFHELWDQERGGYVVRLDVFHTLECLNLLRRGLSPTYYNFTNTEEQRSKLDYCIDQIRQSVMCTSDLTPIPLRYNPGLGHSYPDFEYPHTCRNFDRINRWARARANGLLAVEPGYSSTE